MKLLLFRETRYLASFHQQNATKNTPGRATFHNPLVKTIQPVSQLMEHWNWRNVLA